LFSAPFLWRAIQDRSDLHKSIAAHSLLEVLSAHPVDSEFHNRAQKKAR